ncbi:MAG: hypothetical protein [Caudoviricetes sp.]|nr:MAG: hypothetical protein [Caudoviricetes sp.]
MAGGASYGEDRRGKARQARLGMVRPGMVWQARRGPAGNGRRGKRQKGGKIFGLRMEVAGALSRPGADGRRGTGPDLSGARRNRGKNHCG